MNEQYILRVLNENLGKEGYKVRPLNGGYRVIGADTLRPYDSLRDLVIAHLECFSSRELETWNIKIHSGEWAPKPSKTPEVDLVEMQAKVLYIDNIKFHCPDLYTPKMALARIHAVLDIKDLEQKMAAAQAAKTPREPHVRKPQVAVPPMSQTLRMEIRRREIMDLTPELLISSDRKVFTPKCGKKIHNGLVEMNVVRATQSDYLVVNKVLQSCVLQGVITKTGNRRSTLYHYPQVG